MSVHVHATAFDRVADDYELGRPGYPSALRDWIATRYRTTPGTVIVDLGAGTGKLTRLLVGTGATVVGVEPLENMRRVFARVLPGVELRHGTAQSIPFADGTVDLVTCGQSFRWFACEEALREIARVLRPQAECLLVSNVDGSSPLSERFQQMLSRVDSETDERKPGADWREVLARSQSMAVVDECEFENPYVVDRDGFIARLQSSSQFIRLSPELQERLVDEFDSTVDSWPIELDQVTQVVALQARRGPQ